MKAAFEDLSLWPQVQVASCCVTNALLFTTAQTLLVLIKRGDAFIPTRELQLLHDALHQIKERQTPENLGMYSILASGIFWK